MDTVAWARAMIWLFLFLQEELFTWCVVTRSGQKQLRMRSLIRVKIRQEALQNIHSSPWFDISMLLSCCLDCHLLALSLLTALFQIIQLITVHFVFASSVSGGFCYIISHMNLNWTFFPVFLWLGILIFQNVHIHIVDMSSALQVWEFAQNFSQENTVNVLVGSFSEITSWTYTAY